MLDFQFAFQVHLNQKLQYSIVQNDYFTKIQLETGETTEFYILFIKKHIKISVQCLKIMKQLSKHSSVCSETQIQMFPLALNF